MPMVPDTNGDAHLVSKNEEISNTLTKKIWIIGLDLFARVL